MGIEKKIILPKLGESITNATIVRWFKEVGDRVELDEALLEVATDKVNSEIPSPIAGVLVDILAYPDNEYNVGDEIAIIMIEDLQEIKQEELAEEEPRHSPLVLRLAREHEINLDELQALVGEARITKRDIEAYLESRNKDTSIERIKMTGLRKMIADNMVKSFYEAPHASLVTEIDVTRVLEQIKKWKEKTHIKLSITSVIARAIVEALKAYPILNSSIEGEDILVKKFVNLGIAVSVDQGIIVPVIKDCQNKNLFEIAEKIQELSIKSREMTLAAEDVQGGSITLTNFGMSGVLIGLPIIRYPEVAIIGVGAIHKKVVVLDDGSFAARSIMHISLTFDHRVLDGMYGCGFLKELQKYLEADTPLEQR